jgi:hypothetical protein
LIEQAQRAFREEDKGARVASLRAERDALLQERGRLQAEIARSTPWSSRRFWLGASLSFVGVLVSAFLRLRCQ